MRNRIYKALFTNIRSILILAIFMMLSFSCFSQNDVFDVCRTGSLDDITKLYKADKNVINLINDNGYSALTLACYSGNEEVVAFMVDKVETLNSISKFGSPLMAAVVKGKINIVKLLLKYKAEVNTADAQGITALHYATMFKQTEIVKMLINAGADANLKDGNGKTALNHAETLEENNIIDILKNR